MVPDSQGSESGETIHVARQDRWQVYQRLQELSVPCSCFTDKPLQVQVHSATAALQVWSVVRQITSPRQELAFWLRRCWKVSASRGTI
jgi:hypothetical protein